MNRLLTFVALAVMQGNATSFAAGVHRSAEFWTMVYYANPGGGDAHHPMPIAAIDWRAITHLIDASLRVRADGTLDAERYKITPTYSKSLADAAHAAGRKVLICVAGTSANFRAATNNSNMARMVDAIIRFTVERGYDGVDIDWEPLPHADTAAFVRLIKALREALRLTQPDLLLTAAAWSEASTFAAVQPNLDRINLMAYDQASVRDGYTWHNAALYGRRGSSLNSDDSHLSTFLAAGVAPGKLGLGIPFYGWLWTGCALEPRQRLECVPNLTQLDYSQLAEEYDTAGAKWDKAASVPFISVPGAKVELTRFLSYDDQRSVALKARYARKHRLGGVMVFELSQNYTPREPKERQLPLLRAINSALKSTSGDRGRTPR
jgi:chitinase